MKKKNVYSLNNAVCKCLVFQTHSYLQQNIKDLTNILSLSWTFVIFAHVQALKTQRDAQYPPQPADVCCCITGNYRNKDNICVPEKECGQ